MKLSAEIENLIHDAMGLRETERHKRVVVAMSGGVDSSVVAVLLKLAGYNVVGITLQLYDHGEALKRKGACCAGQDIHDARRVAAAFDIPHYVLDFENRFRESVIDDFVASYLVGQTPVPCVKCNQTVKFVDLLRYAKELDAVAMATGHYIESRAEADDPARRCLFTPADSSRDQSYFLFATTKEQVNFLRFPLGGLPKSETRRLASELGLMVADKPDSQDICFVPQGRYADVILKLRPDAATPGDIVHLDGRILGQHSGIIHYTIGQRRGLAVATGEPLYVIRLDPERHQVIVGPHEALKQTEITLAQLNWLGKTPLTAEPQPVFARIRSTRPPVPATIHQQGESTIVTIPTGEYGVSAGQACVLYEGLEPGSRLWGGGLIAAAAPATTA